jgi:hypothetical protein
MPIIPLNRISSVDIDVQREVGKFAHYEGPVKMKDAALQQIFFTFKDLKLLKFFRLVYDRFNNKELETAKSLRNYDIFETDAGNGRLYVITDISSQALHAFLDDGSVAFKLRGWLEETLRRVVDTSLDWTPLEKWDRYFYGKGTVLPPGVKAIPFYNPDLAPGVPGLILIFVKT